jgi:hypothetical protein
MMNATRTEKGDRVRQGIRDRAYAMGYDVSFPVHYRRIYVQVHRFDRSQVKGLGYLDALSAMSEAQLHAHIDNKLADTEMTALASCTPILNRSEIKRILRQAGCYAMISYKKSLYLNAYCIELRETRHLGRLDAMMVMSETDLKAFIKAKFEEE